eukprot:gene4968-5616_t
MGKYGILPLAIILVKLVVQTAAYKHDYDTVHQREITGAKKSIIPRHESDTKYGALYKVVEPPEEIEKRSRFGGGEGSVSQLYKLENFILGYSKHDLKKNLKKSDIVKEQATIAKTANENNGTQSEEEDIAEIRDIIQRLSADDNVQSSDSNLRSIKKQSIAPEPNTQKQDLQDKNGKIENADPTSKVQNAYGSSPSNPGLSCTDIFQKYPDYPSGVYWIKTADGKENLKIHCEKAANNMKYVKPILDTGKEWKPLEKSNKTGLTSPKYGKKVVHSVVGDHLPMGDNPDIDDEKEPEDPDQIKSGMWPYDTLSAIVPTKPMPGNKTTAQSPAGANTNKTSTDKDQQYLSDTLDWTPSNKNNNSKEVSSKQEEKSGKATTSPSSPATSKGDDSKNKEEPQNINSWKSVGSASDLDKTKEGQALNYSSAFLDKLTAQPTTQKPVVVTKRPTTVNRVTPSKPTPKHIKKPETLEEFEQSKINDNLTNINQTAYAENFSDLSALKNDAKNPKKELETNKASKAGSTALTGDTAKVEDTAFPKSLENSTDLDKSKNQQSGNVSNKTIANNTESSVPKQGTEKVQMENTTNIKAQKLSSNEKSEERNLSSINEKQQLNGSSLNRNENVNTNKTGNGEEINSTMASTNATSNKTANNGNEGEAKMNKQGSDNVLNSKASYQYIENKTTPLDNTAYHDALDNSSTSDDGSHGPNQKGNKKPEDSILAQNLISQSSSKQADGSTPSRLQDTTTLTAMQAPAPESTEHESAVPIQNQIQILPDTSNNSIQPLAVMPLSQISVENQQFLVNSTALSKNSTMPVGVSAKNPIASERTLNSSATVAPSRGEDGTISEAPLTASPNADIKEKSNQEKTNMQLNFIKNGEYKDIKDYDIYEVGKKKSIMSSKNEQPKRSPSMFKDLNTALQGTNFSVQNGVNTHLTFKSNIPNEIKGTIINEEKRSHLSVNKGLQRGNQEKRAWQKELTKISDSLQGTNLSIQNNVDSRLTFKSKLPLVKLRKHKKHKKHGRKSSRVKRSSISSKLHQPAVPSNLNYKQEDMSKTLRVENNAQNVDTNTSTDTNSAQSNLLIKNVVQHSIDDNNVLKAVFNIQSRNESKEASSNESNILVKNIEKHKIDDDNILHAVFNVRKNQENIKPDPLSLNSTSQSLSLGHGHDVPPSSSTARTKIAKHKIIRKKSKHKIKKLEKKSKTRSKHKKPTEIAAVKNESKKQKNTSKFGGKYSKVEKEKLKISPNKKKNKDKKSFKKKKMQGKSKVSVAENNGVLYPSINNPRLLMKRQEVSITGSSLNMETQSRQLIATEIGKIEPSKGDLQEKTEQQQSVTKNSNQPTNTTVVANSTNQNTESIPENKLNSMQKPLNSTYANNSKSADLLPESEKQGYPTMPKQYNNGQGNANANADNTTQPPGDKIPNLNQILNFTVGFLNKTFHEHFQKMKDSDGKLQNAENANGLPSSTVINSTDANGGQNSSQNNSTGTNSTTNQLSNKSDNQGLGNTTSNKTNTDQQQISPAIQGQTSLPGALNSSSATAFKSQKVPDVSNAAAVSDMMSPVENYILNMINTSGAEHFGNGTGKREATKGNVTENQNENNSNANAIKLLNDKSIDDISKLGNIHITSNQYSIRFSPKKPEKRTGISKSGKKRLGSKISKNSIKVPNKHYKSQNIFHSKISENTKNSIANKKRQNQNDSNQSNQGSTSGTNGFPIKINGSSTDWGPLSENWPHIGFG